MHAPLTGDANSRTRLTFVSILVALVVPVWLAMAGDFAYHDAALRLGGKVTVAEVVHVNGDKQPYSVTVRLPAPVDREVAVVAGNGQKIPPYSVGSRLAVRYDPAEPEYVEYASEGFSWPLPLLALGFSALLLFIAWRDMTLQRRLGRAAMIPAPQG